MVNKHRKSVSSDLKIHKLMKQQSIVKLCYIIESRSVELFWMGVSMSIEISLINVSPIKLYPIKTLAASLNFTENQCFHECFPSTFVKGKFVKGTWQILW